MRTFLKVTLLLGFMVLALLALPVIASKLCSGIISGMTAAALLALALVLFLGLATIGSGTAALVGLVVLITLACAALAIILPVALPVLLVVALIAIPIKLAQRLSRPTLA